MVALRTDIDALPMPELNVGLSYKTKTECAHMCGHDGHMAMMLAAANLFADKK
jgi:metal-dependent amidase/aminoacylase/carboxypeptidase family protein